MCVCVYVSYQFFLKRVNKNLIYYLVCTKEQSGWFSKAVSTAKRLVQQGGWYSKAIGSARRLVQQGGWFSKAVGTAKRSVQQSG